MSVNKVILIGNLGKDPEMRYTSGGQAVANFSLATTDSYTNKEGEKQENTEWHRIVAWGRLAEICGEYLSKGKMIYIEGSIKTRAWEDSGGNKKWTTEIVARNMQMLGGGKGDNPETSKQTENSKPETKEAQGELAGEDFDGQDSINQDIPF